MQRILRSLTFSLLLVGTCAQSSPLVAGFVGQPTGGFRQTWHTHLGDVPILGIRQEPPNLEVSWQTAPVPDPIGADAVTFAWTGAMGAGVAAAGNFTLWVNDRPAADFDAVGQSARFLSRATGCALCYDVQWSGRGDTSGHFFLTVPADWLASGRPATLKVTARDIGAHRWFGLITGGDAPSALPQRRWRQFQRWPQPARPPESGQEADFDVYLPQYSDPGCFTPIGLPGDPAETAVSPTGQLMTGLDYTQYAGGLPRTEPPYLRHALAFALWENGRLVPVGADTPARQSLQEGHFPIVHTDWEHGPLKLRETAYSEPLADTPYESGTERTLAWAVWEITNSSPEDQPLTFLAFHVGDERNPFPTMEYRDGAVLSGGSALFSCQAPRGFRQQFHSTFPEGLVIDASRPFQPLVEDRGAGNVLVVEGTLHAGRTVRIIFNRVFDFRGTYHWKAPTLPPVEPRQTTGQSWQRGLSRAEAAWHSAAARVAEIRTPDARLDAMVRKGMLDGYFLTKKWNGRDIVFDAVNYRCQWDDSSAKWFYALDLLGDHDTAERLLDTVFARQGQRKPAGTRTREGCFSDVTNIEKDGSAASWTACNGWALWAMAQHARLSGDRDWFAQHKAEMLAGCDWILRERAFSREKPDNPCAGLLHGKFVCDLPDKGEVSGVGYFTYTDAISYMGLQQTGQLLSDWGYPDGERILSEAEAYRKDIVAAVDRLTDKTRDPWYIPWMLHAPKYEDRYFYDVCGPINLAYGGVLPRDDERIAHVIRWIVDHEHGGSLEETTAGRTAAGEGGMFYSQDLAVTLLELGRVEDFLRVFYTLLSADVSHETLTTCEWRRNTQPHVHSISSMVRMYRTMLVQERDGGLFLLQGTPRRWLEDGAVIAVKHLPTWYGPLSLACRSRLEDGQVRVEMQLPERTWGLPIALHLRLPEGRRIAGAVARPDLPVQVDGEWIRFEGRPGRLDLTVACPR